LRAIAKALDELSKTDISTTVFSDYNEQFQSFAILAFVILLIEILMFDRVNKRLSRMKIFDLKDKI